MNSTRIVATLCVALGLAGISVALGFIYIDFIEREGAWMELTARHGDLDESEEQELLAAWEDPGHAWPALGAGTLGVALLGSGVMLAAFQLPVFNKANQPAPLTSDPNQ